jgi:hypothetical protein
MLHVSHIESKLMCFERKILRKIFGPLKNNDGSYRIGYNAELEELIHHEHVVRYIKSQRLRWAGHVVRMGEYRLPHIGMYTKKYIFTLINNTVTTNTYTCNI